MVKRKTASKPKRADISFRKGLSNTFADIAVENGIVRMRLSCMMDSGDSRIAEVSLKYRPCLRIDFQSADGRFNLSLKGNGTISVSNAKGGDTIEVDQAWPIGRVAGLLEGITWLIRDGTMFIGGEGKVPDFVNTKDTPWYIFRSNIKKIEIADEVTSLGNRCFSGLRNLAEADLGNVTVVRSRSFAGCPALSNVSMDAVQAINSSAFQDCTSLVSVRFGSKLKKLDKCVFSGCSALRSVLLNGRDAPSVDPTAFSGCTGLTVTSCHDSDVISELVPGADCDAKKIAQVYAEETQGSEGQHPGEHVNRHLLSVRAADLRGNMLDLTDEYSVEPAIIGSAKQTTLSISYCGTSALLKVSPVPRTSGSNVIEWTFDADTGRLSIGGTARMPDYDAIEQPPWQSLGDAVSEVSISAGIQNIGKRAFDGCKGLRTVHAEDVTAVGDYAFRNCSALEMIHLGSVKTVGSFCFQGCTALVSVSFGPNISRIGRQAFAKCGQLAVLRLECDAAPALGESCFIGVSQGLIIVSKLADGWADQEDATIIYRKG